MPCVPAHLIANRGILGDARPANSKGRQQQQGKGSMPINSKYLFVASMDVGGAF